MKTVSIIFILLLAGCSTTYTTESFVYQDDNSCFSNWGFMQLAVDSACITNIPGVACDVQFYLL